MEKRKRLMATLLIFALAVTIFLILSGLKDEKEDATHKFDATIYEADGHQIIIPGDPYEDLENMNDYIYPKYLPEGYCLIDVINAEEERCLIFREFDDNLELFLVQWPTGMGRNFDPAWSFEKECTVLGYNAIIYSHEEERYVIWQSEDSDYMLRHQGAIAMADLEDIIEGLEERN